MHITSHQPSPTGMLRIHFLTDEEVTPGDHQVHWQPRPHPGCRVLSIHVPTLVSQLIIRLMLQQVRKRKDRAAWDRTETGWCLCVWLLPPVPLLFHSLPLLKSSLRSTSYKTQWNKSWFIHKMKWKECLINSYLFTSGILRAQPAAKSGYLKTVGFSEKA